MPCSVCNQLKKEDPVVITLIVLFVVICVLLGICTFAGWYCKIHKTITIIPNDSLFNKGFKEDKPIIQQVSEPAVGQQVVDQQVAKGAQAYTSELSF